MSAQKPRVMFLIDSLQMGGAERITAAVMPHFETVEPVLCTLIHKESPLNDMIGDVPHIQLGASRLLDPGALLRLFRVIREQRIDIIHAQLWYATIFAALANRRLGVPVVTTRHVMDDDLSTRKRQIIIRLERLAIKYGTQRLIYVSEASLKRHRETIGMTKPPAAVIYNGLDFAKFNVTQERAAMRQSLGIDESAPVALMVGVMRPGKGHDVALRAAELLPDVQFVLVGDGEPDFMAPLQRQAQELPNVHMLGRRMDVPDLLAMSDVFILPSDSEALPTVLIEAGAMGLPAVATRVGGIPEIVQDSKTGVLIQPQNPQQLADALQRLLNAPDELQRMGDAAREFVHHRFAIQRQAQQLAQLYRDVIAEK